MDRRILQIFLFFIVAFVFATPAAAPRVFALTQEFSCAISSTGTTSECTAIADPASNVYVYYGEYPLNTFPANYGSIGSFDGMNLSTYLSGINPNAPDLDGAYYLFSCYGSSGLSGNPDICASQSTTTAQIFPFYYESGVFYSVNSSSTRIVTVDSPLDGSIQPSTTVTFSGSYYVSSEDAPNPTNVFVDLYIINRSTNATTSLNDQYLIRLPVSSFDQIVSFSTSTVLLDDARYAWDAQLTRGDMILLASEYFALPGNLNFLQFTTGNFDPSYGLDYDVSSCNLIAFSGFDIQDCLYNLIFPNNFVFSTKVDIMRDTYFRAAPLGYATRFVSILTNTATTSLPTISYTFPSDSMFGAATFAFDPFGTLLSSTSPINFLSNNESNPQTLWQIMEYPVTIVVYLMLIFMIVHDLTGISKHRKI